MIKTPLHIAYNFRPIALVFALLTVASLPAPAQATLRICNETGESRSVVIGFKKDGKWISKGWWNVENTKCVTPLKEELESRFYYYRATSGGGDFDGENYFFCSTKKAFTIEGDKDCQERGHQRSNFRELKLAKGTLGYQLTLNDQTIYTPGQKPAQKKSPPKSQKPVARSNRATSESPTNWLASTADAASLMAGRAASLKPINASIWRSRTIEPKEPFLTNWRS